MNISEQSIENITDAVINQMVLEAAYKGETVTSGDIVMAVLTDPNGATAQFFNSSMADSVALFIKMQNEPELLKVFGRS